MRFAMHTYASDRLVACQLYVKFVMRICPVSELTRRGGIVMPVTLTTVDLKFRITRGRMSRLYIAELYLPSRVTVTFFYRCNFSMREPWQQSAPRGMQSTGVFRL